MTQTTVSTTKKEMTESGMNHHTRMMIGLTTTKQENPGKERAKDRIPTRAKALFPEASRQKGTASSLTESSVQNVALSFTIVHNAQ